MVSCICSDQDGEFGSHHERPSDEGGTAKKSLIPVFDRACALHEIDAERYCCRDILNFWMLSRKRLIFVGFTPERMGWRCFDPIDFKFTTEWELIFDEHSAEKRKNNLGEYDERRKLQSEGKLEDVPVVIDEL